MALRYQNQAFLFKAESSEGVDASPSASVDAIEIDSVTVTPTIEVIDQTAAHGGIDKARPSIGKITMRVEGAANLKGAGVAATAPEIHALLESCGWVKTAGTAIPASSTTTAAAGTATSFDITIGATNWPASTSAGAVLIGRDVLLAGNPATEVRCRIIGYTVDTGVATVTVDKTFSPALSNATTAAIPAQPFYTPSSGTIPSGTAYCYYDGKLITVLGCRGNAELTLTAGQRAQIKFTLEGVFGAESDASVPAVTLANAAPPIWRAANGGKFMVDGAVSRPKTFSLNLNNTLFRPDNPNAQQGIDPTIITQRDAQGQIDPQTVLKSAWDPLGKIIAGTDVILTAALGSVPGNIIGVTVLRAAMRNRTLTNDSGILRDTIPYSAVCANDGAILTFP